jgi:tetratricopeptide (TPR) repeat protein
MTCTDVQERDLAEGYVLGRLDEAERDAFEQHYFECARCYSRVQALGAVRDALARQPRQSGVRIPMWLGVAAALVLAVSAAVAWRTVATEDRPHSSAATAASEADARRRARTEEIARLALVTPPPYEPARLRSGGEREAFTSGMTRYAAGDVAGAIPLLRRALDETPSAEDVRFYLGASQLLNGQPAEAIDTLQRLAARAQSPYAEEAQFLIAKGHLRQGDLRAATADLDKTITMRGDRETDARAIRARVAELDAAR